jgi:hypothetical protein
VLAPYLNPPIGITRRNTISRAARLVECTSGTNNRSATASRKGRENEMGISEHAALIEFDGRVGEGGGQLVRVAVALAAITGTPIRIHHVRANR